MTKPQKRKFNKKIIIISVTILLVLFLIIGCISSNNSPSNNKTSNNNGTSNETSNNETSNKELNIDLSYYCSKYENVYKNTTLYETNDDVYCQINFSSNNNLAEVQGELSFDNELELQEEYQTSPSWNLTQENNKFHLVVSNSKKAKYTTYQIKFKIKPTNKEELNIHFKNITVKDINNNYYTSYDKTINLPIKALDNYKYEKKDNELVFYKLENSIGYKEINRYKCQYDDCNGYDIEDPAYPALQNDYDNGIMLIYDGKNAENVYYKKLFLYNFNNGIVKTFENIYPLKKGLKNYNELPTFTLENINNEMAIVDINGKYIKEFSDKKFTFFCYKGCWLDNYLIENDLIVTYNENGYGIDKISKNEEVIEHTFDDIVIGKDTNTDVTSSAGVYNNNKLFKAKKDNKWYLYNLETKEKVFESGYDGLFLIDNEIILVLDNNTIYIKDLNNNNLTKDTINLEYGLLLGIGLRERKGIIISKEDNIISISLVDGTDYNNYTFKNYEYNIKTKQLTKVINQ